MPTNARTRSQRGLTLVEFLVAALLLGAGAVALLMGMQYTMIQTSYLRQYYVMLNQAQGQLETLSSGGFDALETDPACCDGSRARTRSVVLPADLNVLVPGGVLAVQIVQVGNPTAVFFDVQVAACWTHRGRFIGEESAANQRDCRDGADAGVWVNGPVVVSTRVARSE